MSEATAARFFAGLASHADAAERAADGTSGAITDRWYRLGGAVLQIRFIGTALLEVIGNAIAHCEIDSCDDGPDMRLRCWDCASLRLPYPDAPVTKDAFTPRGDVHTLTDERYQTAFDPPGRLLSMMDGIAREALYCVGRATDIPRFDAAEPIRSLLSWFVRQHGGQLVHAAAVGSAAGGVLLMGRSGAGKSNTSLTCLNDGMGFVSDDFCSISVGGAEPRAYSLYCTAKTRESDVDRSPFLRGLAPEYDPTRLDKIIYYLARAAPERLIESFPIKALLLVRQDGDHCHVTPVAPSAALASTAPDTARLLANAGGEVLQTLGQLVRRVPCYTLHLGPDRHAIAPTIQALLDRFAARSDAG